ncbi:MAG: aldo/keto reductase [Alphaproteobacteria bacterium]|nr:aldo/keto reductase [Alphaproteobacteria bacterium]
MDYVNLGRTGLMVSRLCLGCMSFGSRRVVPWVVEEAEARPFYRHALDSGINFFDTANSYSLGASEEITGRALVDYAGRHNVVIATKVYSRMGPEPNDRGLSRRHIMQSVDASLKRLGTDWIDLFNVHRYDRTTPEDETMDALDTIVRAGKVRYLGASNLNARHLVRMHQIQKHSGLARFVNYQVHYNLINREEERENIPYATEEGIALTPWSPLARGWLAGKQLEETVRARTDGTRINAYGSPNDLAIIARLDEVAKRHGVPPAQAAMAWLLAKPGITSPIVGATKIVHLDDAVAALDLGLSPDEIAYLEAPYEPHNLVGLTANEPFFMAQKAAAEASANAKAEGGA